MNNFATFSHRIVTICFPWLLTTFFLPIGTVRAEGLVATRLRCEYREYPLGIDQSSPRLSWVVESAERGQRQTAYRIIVASSRKLIDRFQGDVWDTGKVTSDETLQIEYGGPALKSKEQRFWKVQVWDRRDEPSPWSLPAMWSMGLLRPGDWQAKYITYRDNSALHRDRDSLHLPPARQYRKEFELKKSIRRATIYASALGIYELHVNGKRTDSSIFPPGWSDYGKRAYYQTCDVTDQVQIGMNAIGIWVADGWYSGYLAFGLLEKIGTERIGRYTYGKTPAVLAQLEIEYDDGTSQLVPTDASWRLTGEGPIREADLLMGEFYDARRETPGWTEAGYDDSSWESAILATDGKTTPATFYEFRNPTEENQGPQIQGRPIELKFERPQLEATPGVPVLVTQELSPVNITTPVPGVHIFNLGQNFAGIVRLRARGKSGQKIRLRYGEMLHPDGRLMTENLRRARATDYYIMRGDPEGEIYQPRFTFHGFQYVEITGLDYQPDLETIQGLVLQSDTPLVGSFTCSDPMVNQLYENIVWTQRANFLDLPTDCPQRDERCGWTGDAQIYIRSATYNADVAAFYTKWLRELMDSQRSSGAFPGYAPFPFQHGWDFGTAWADAGVICPWTIWKVYGDTRVIDQCWPSMERFMDWRLATSENYLGVVHGNNWGDWLAQGETTPIDYIDSIYFAYSTKLMIDMAEATGRQVEASKFQEQLDQIKTAFGEKYLKPDGRLAVDTQTAYALALFADVVPQKVRAQSGEWLAEKIHKNGNRMATGFLGSRPLLPALSSVGQNDLAVFLLQSRDFPSWGYEVEQGATTIWERWDSYTKKDGFGRHNAAMNSFAHYAFGSVCEWMFSSLAGIESDGAGYKRLLIAPSPPATGSNGQYEAVSWIDARYDSPRGSIISKWKVSDRDFHLQVTIPTNTTATIAMPVRESSAIKLDDIAIEKHDNIHLHRIEYGRAMIHVPSGSYSFVSTDSIPRAGEALSTRQVNHPQ